MWHRYLTPWTIAHPHQALYFICLAWHNDLISYVCATYCPLSTAEESVFYKCPDRLRLPLIFYFAHTATVYVNKLLLASFIKVIYSWNILTCEQRLHLKSNISEDDSIATSTIYLCWSLYINSVSFFQSRVNFEFETMFETGVDEMSWDDTVSHCTAITDSI